MNTLSKLREVVSSCGNILRGTIEVSGREYRIEGNVQKTWLHIIDDASCCEQCVIDGDGDVISEGGEIVTKDWTDSDWSDLTSYVGVK